VSGVTGHVTHFEQGHGGDEDARENNTQAVEDAKSEQQIAPQQHANNSHTTLHFLPEQQPKGVVTTEDYIGSLNTNVEIRNTSITSHDTTLQQSEHIRNPEDLQRDSTTDTSDAVIVFPWHVEGKSDSIEAEDVFLVYPSDSDENNTDAWYTNITDAGSLSSNMAELSSFASEDDKYLMETPISSSTGLTFSETVDVPDKEYLVASGSEYKGVRSHNEMQEDLEDDGERDVDGDTNEDEDNDDQIESSIHELHTMKDIIQNKRPNIPKRSFVSQNLKTRISQLATGERRRNPGADEVRSVETRHITGPRSGQRRTEAVTNKPRGSSPLKTRIPNRDTRHEANNNKTDTEDRMTVRSRSRSNLKPSTRDTQESATASRASKSQNTFSRQLNKIRTHGTVSDLGSSQIQGDHQRQGTDYEMAFPRHRQINLKRNSEVMPEIANDGQGTPHTNFFTTGDHPTIEKSVINATDKRTSGTQNSTSGQNVVEHNRRPVVRRKAIEKPHRTFGARTRTRDRPSSFQTKPTHAQTVTEASTDSDAQKFAQSQQTGQDVFEHRPSDSGAAGITTVTSMGMDTGSSLIGEFPVRGLINVVGPIPTGFTDPATIKDLNSVNQMGPLFHLPYPIPPEEFRNQIPNSNVPMVSTTVTPSAGKTLPSSGVTSFNQDVNVFRQPYTQTFEQHYTFRHSETHSPQKYIQTIIATPNSANVNRHKWQLHEPKQLVSDNRSHFSPQVQSSLTASTSNPPSMQNLAKFTEPRPFHFPPLNNHQKTTVPHAPVTMVHSSPNDETIRAKIVRLPQTPSLQKFLSFPDQQVKQTGHQKENLVPLKTQVSQPSTEDRPVPLLDATNHAAQLEYTKKLQEYFQRVQSYYRQQHHHQ
jgi:hypothetical protein